ncbi:MAG: glycosyltransferase family 4 protein [Gammaproteobacteria bacterium]|nr:glycosyltransferase family 4 protein [Gammaproteobacteria bacterium]
MKIISVNKYYWHKGGSEAVFFAEKNLLELHGHSVIPFSMRHKNNLATDYSRYFVDEVDYLKIGLAGKLSAALKVIYSLDAKRKMDSLLSTEVIDISHFHIFQHQISPSVFGPLKKKNIPIVLTLHDLKPMCPNYKMYTHGAVCEKCMGRRFYNCLLNKCTKDSAFKSMVNVVEMYMHYALQYYQNVDKYISPSNFHRNKMIKFGYPEGQIVTIPNFIDASQFEISNEDHGYGLYFGRLSDEKDVCTLLEACKKCPNIPVVIVGNGPAEGSLKQLAKDLGLNNVQFLGYKVGKNLIDVVQKASFTILTSRIYENCPMSILESHATGKAVIASHIGGIPELIKDGQDGFTFESGNPDDLAEKMIFLWRDKNTRVSMGLSGRKKIETEFTPERHYDQLISVYSSLL